MAVVVPPDPILVTAPSLYVLPISLDQAKRAIGIPDADDIDEELYDLIREGASKVESDARRCILTQTWKQLYDYFPCGDIEITKVPVASVTHVKYYTNDVLTTLSSALYETDLLSEPARIRMLNGTSWPSTDTQLNAVEVQWVAGYASSASVPLLVKSAVKLAVRQAFYNSCESDNYWALIKRLRRSDDALH